MAKSEKITTMTFQLPVSVKKRLKQVAAKRGCSLRKVLNDAIAKVK